MPAPVPKNKLKPDKNHKTWDQGVEGVRQQLDDWRVQLNDLGHFLMGPHEQSLLGLGELAAGFTPGAAIQDALDSSKEFSSGVVNQNPWESAIGLAGMVASFIPGPSGQKEMDFIHGSQHKFEPVGNHVFGKFDNAKLLSGEGTNYEGAGHYLTDPTANEVADYYSQMGPLEATVSIGDTRLDDEFAKLRKEHNQIYADGDVPVDLETVPKKFELMEQLQEEAAKMATSFAGLNPNKDTVDLPPEITNEWLDKVIKDSQVEHEDMLKYLNSFRDKGATIKQPGGFIYDVSGNMAPEDFLNMHMPLQYQDDKVISAVDEWLKRMPMAKFDEATRDPIRKQVIDDPFHVPYKTLTPILGDQYAIEHANILKDLGLPGQKWFSSYADGRQRRRDSYSLFEKLKGQGKDASHKSDILKQIKELDNIIENKPLTPEHLPAIMEAQSKKVQLQNYLSGMGDNVEASLYNLYNRDPVYNYVVNDPERLTITGRTFTSKGRRY